MKNVINKWITVLLKLVLVAILKNKLRIFIKKYSECKACNIEGVSKRYYTNIDETLQQCRYKYARFNNLDNRL